MEDLRRFDAKRSDVNGEANDKTAAAAAEGSIHGFESLHRLLEANLKPEVFQEVSRLLLGLNCGRPLERIELPELACSLSAKHDFDMQISQLQPGRDPISSLRVLHKSITICWIVRSYLLHYGYQDTLNSFDTESENSALQNPTSQENGIYEHGDAYALNHRKILRQLIRKGDIDTALHNLRDWYSQVVQDETSTICFLLHSQRFIEYIREDQLLEAVSYARTELNKFLKVEPFEGMLEDAIALLAYDDPAKSCVGYLLEQSQREFVADAVNAVILSTNPNTKNTENCMYSCLEKLLRQLSTCILERRALNENQGEAFDLHREQLRWGWDGKA